MAYKILMELFPKDIVNHCILPYLEDDSDIRVNHVLVQGEIRAFHEYLIDYHGIMSKGYKLFGALQQSWIDKKVEEALDAITAEQNLKDLKSFRSRRQQYIAKDTRKFIKEVKAISRMPGGFLNYMLTEPNRWPKMLESLKYYIYGIMKLRFPVWDFDFLSEYPTGWPDRAPVEVNREAIASECVYETIVENEDDDLPIELITGADLEGIASLIRENLKCFFTSKKDSNKSESQDE